MSGLIRSLDARSTNAIVIGGVIGSGIFMKPALMAGQLGSPILLLSVWLIAGVITLFGALSNSEAAAMFPETGGQYAFFEKMYGPGFAFIYGWACFAVINTAGVASIAYVCAQYGGYFFELPRFSEAVESAFSLHIPYLGSIYPLKDAGLKVFTVVLVVAFTIVNYRSLNYGAGLQRILTWIKGLAIVALIIGIFFSGKGSINNLSHEVSAGDSGFALFSAYMAAIAGAFWAYDGWNNITFVAGEIKDPQRNIPRSLLLGLSFCIIVYFLLNLAYLYVLPIEQMANSSFVASDAALVSWGSSGAGLIALMVIFSTLGAANANVMSTARVTFAMADAVRFFRPAGIVHKKYGTPANALVFNLCWTCVLVISGSFDMLTDMLIFVSWFFYGMSGVGIFILRKKMKDVERPYRVWGYPFVPAVFVIFSFVFLLGTLYKDISSFRNGYSTIINSLLGIAITLPGLPLYYWSRRKV